MSKNRSILLLCFLMMLTMESCLQVLDVDIEEEDARTVIEGNVTNQLDYYYVRISKTLVLDEGNNYPAINNAEVVISDDAGNTDTLQLTNNGVYKTAVKKQGVAGRTYYLSVKIDGFTYAAQDKMPAITPVDSIFSVYLTAGTPGIRRDGHYVFFNTTDPANEKNYYRYKMYRNNNSVLSVRRMIVFDDRFLNPVVLARIPGRYNPGDSVRFERYALSEPCYKYYDGVSTLLINDGGFFSTPPANAPTNISGGALGFFQASAMTADTLVIQ